MTVASTTPTYDSGPGVTHVDTSCLDNWADPDTLDTYAGNLKTHGSDFKTAITDAKNSWQGLTASFKAPGDTSLFAALDTPATKAGNVSSVAASISTSITTFASTTRTLQTERTNLLAKVATFNNAEFQCTADDAKNASDSSSSKNKRGEEGAALQVEVWALARKYQNAVDTCAADLGNINEDGTKKHPLQSAFDGYTQGLFRSTLVSFATSYRAPLLRGKQLVAKINGKTIRGPKFEIPGKGAKFDPNSWFFYKKSMNNGFTEMPSTVIKSGPKGKWGVGFEHTTGGTTVGAVGKAAGRAAFVVGAALTYKSEYDTAQQKLKEENPGLSDKERRSKAVETAAVRGTGQLAAAALTGAAIGSALPVGGTAVGLAVGAAVGAAMMIPTGDGKNVGDRIGDASEAVWSGAKKAGSGIKNAFKKIF